MLGDAFRPGAVHLALLVAGVLLVPGATVVSVAVPAPGCEPAFQAVPLIPYPGREPPVCHAKSRADTMAPIALAWYEPAPALDVLEAGTLPLGYLPGGRETYTVSAYLEPASLGLQALLALAGAFLVVAWVRLYRDEGRATARWLLQPSRARLVAAALGGAPFLVMAVPDVLGLANDDALGPLYLLLLPFSLVMVAVGSSGTQAADQVAAWYGLPAFDPARDVPAIPGFLAGAAGLALAWYLAWPLLTATAGWLRGLLEGARGAPILGNGPAALALAAGIVAALATPVEAFSGHDGTFDGQLFLFAGVAGLGAFAIGRMFGSPFMVALLVALPSIVVLPTMHWGRNAPFMPIWILLGAAAAVAGALAGSAWRGRTRPRATG